MATPKLLPELLNVTTLASRAVHANGPSVLLGIVQGADPPSLEHTELSWLYAVAVTWVNCVDEVQPEG